MSNYRIKNLPQIKLLDLLRKRRTNLKEFLKNSGIASYTTLVQKCVKICVSSPTEDEFKTDLGEAVSSPQEGVVVLDPPALIKDTGEKISVDDASTFLTDKPELHAEPEQPTKNRKKKPSEIT